MRTAAKRDTNEKAIVAHLEAIGARVIQINQKDTFDLLVAYRGRLFIMEVKNPEYRVKSKPASAMLTKGENKCRLLIEGAKVPYHIVFTAQEAQEIVMGNNDHNHKIR